MTWPGGSLPTCATTPTPRSFRDESGRSRDDVANGLGAGTHHKEFVMTTEHTSPTAAGSGASASQAFRASRADHDIRAVSAQRVDEVVGEMLAAIHGVIREKSVSYPEFQAAKQWLMDVGEGGEWPLLLAGFAEGVVGDGAGRSHERS